MPMQNFFDLSWQWKCILVETKGRRMVGEHPLSLTWTLAKPDDGCLMPFAKVGLGRGWWRLSPRVCVADHCDAALSASLGRGGQQDDKRECISSELQQMVSSMYLLSWNTRAMYSFILICGYIHIYIYLSAVCRYAAMPSPGDS